jgi:hypothetical protein
MGLYNIEENYPLKKLLLELGGVYIPAVDMD